MVDPQKPHPNCFLEAGQSAYQLLLAPDGKFLGLFCPSEVLKTPRAFSCDHAAHALSDVIGYLAEQGGSKSFNDFALK